MALELTDLLDPRISADPPFAGAVHIPWTELPARSQELPPKGALVRVIDCNEADEACEWLEASGRVTSVAPGMAGFSAGQLRLWRPSEWLATVAAELKPGTALDIGCGSGRDAVYLSSLGWQVTAIDHLPDALDRARELERRYLDHLAIAWVCGRAEEFEPLGEFDLINMSMFCAPMVVQRLAGWLNPGGVAVIETFSTERRSRTGKPSNQELVLNPADLAGLEIFGSEVTDRTSRVCAKFNPTR